MEKPKLSVVITAHNVAHVISECLSALQVQKGFEQAEVIVADSSTDGTAEVIQERFPEVKVLHFSQPLTVPQLRHEGISLTRGQIIAILDPFSVVEGQWLSELLKVHQERPEWVIGGAVELHGAHRHSLVHWANYISEYGGFMLPLEAGVVPILPGSNISYKRQAWGVVKPLQQAGFWKTFVNWQLEANNQALWLAPSVMVRLLKPISFGEFLRSRYHHGRCFAAMRLVEIPGQATWLRALTTPLLPGVFLGRLAHSYWPKQRHRREFVLTAPLLLLLFSSWAWGELWGYMRGAGRSCAELFY